MSPDPNVRGPNGEDPRSVGEMVFDVSEQVSTLVREEIELAKAEVTEKVTALLRGGVVGIAAGVFALMGLAMLMHGIAWLLNDLFFEDDVWIGFMVEALFWFGVAAGAGYFAYRSFQKGSPPTPDLAIEEAKRVRQTLEGDTTPYAREP
ncbi:MAG: phage holin family protein [bacterium]